MSWKCLREAIEMSLLGVVFITVITGIIEGLLTLGEYVFKGYYRLLPLFIFLFLLLVTVFYLQCLLKCKSNAEGK